MSKKFKGNLRDLSPDVARVRFAEDRALYESRGVIFPAASSYLPAAYRHDYGLAMDAYPGAPQSLIQTDPNSAVPALLTTYIDPDVYEVLFAANTAADIFGEVRKGDWLTDTALFPIAEHTGEVSSYGDRSNNGRANANTNWANYQSYLWQTIMEYGERELERAGLARLNWVSELNKSAATLMDKFANLTYFFGVTGLENYGLLNDPLLAAPLSPAPKANGGVTWFTSGGSPNATANEVFNDIVAIVTALVAANAGNVDRKTKMTLAMSPESAMALTFTNSFAVNVEDLLQKNFPNMEIKTGVQYGVASVTNPQGNAAGNYVQLLADTIMGQDVGFTAYSEKMRSHKIVFDLSSFRQKVTGGSWGAVIRMPVGLSGMVGV
jgi:Uncharacterized protein conserved in bacteria (DUF2184)